MTDEEFMRIAIDISRKSKHPYGAIVVKDDKIIGRSDRFNGGGIYDDAEYRAICDAVKDKGLYGKLKNCSIYSSCEPCLMCLGAILYEGINKIVFGATIEDSNKYYCDETIVKIQDVIKKSNKKDVVVKNILRDEAVKVLKERQIKKGDKNGI